MCARHDAHSLAALPGVQKARHARTPKHVNKGDTPAYIVQDVAEGRIMLMSQRIRDLVEYINGEVQPVGRVTLSGFYAAVTRKPRGCDRPSAAVFHHVPSPYKNRWIIQACSLTRASENFAALRSQFQTSVILGQPERLDAGPAHHFSSP